MGSVSKFVVLSQVELAAAANVCEGSNGGSVQTVGIAPNKPIASNHPQRAQKMREEMDEQANQFVSKDNMSSGERALQKFLDADFLDKQALVNKDTSEGHYGRILLLQEAIQHKEEMIAKAYAKNVHDESQGGEGMLKTFEAVVKQLKKRRAAISVFEQNQLEIDADVDLYSQLFAGLTVRQQAQRLKEAHEKINEEMSTIYDAHTETFNRTMETKRQELAAKFPTALAKLLEQSSSTEKTTKSVINCEKKGGQEGANAVVITAAAMTASAIAAFLSDHLFDSLFSTLKQFFGNMIGDLKELLGPLVEIMQLWMSQQWKMHQQLNGITPVDEEEGAKVIKKLESTAVQKQLTDLMGKTSEKMPKDIIESVANLILPEDGVKQLMGAFFPDETTVKTMKESLVTLGFEPPVTYEDTVKVLASQSDTPHDLPKNISELQDMLMKTHEKITKPQKDAKAGPPEPHVLSGIKWDDMLQNIKRSDEIANAVRKNGPFKDLKGQVNKMLGCGDADATRILLQLQAPTPDQAKKLRKILNKFNPENKTYGFHRLQAILPESAAAA